MTWHVLYRKHLNHTNNNNNMSTKQITFAMNTKPENHGAIRLAKPILRKLKKRKALEVEGGWYFNSKGVELGPYDGRTIRAWLEADAFGPSQEIRMGKEGDFAEVSAHFPEISEAFCVTSKLCLYLLSSVEDKTVRVVKDGKSQSLSVDDIAELILYGKCDSGCKRWESGSDAWIGDYYIGKLDQIGEMILDWSMDTFYDRVVVGSQR